MAKKVKKKELGLGIRALLGNVEEEAAKDQEKVVRELSHNIAMIPLEEIEANPYQPRNAFDEEALRELAESIQVHGLIQPVTVRRLNPHAYQLISGERRLRASREAGLKEIPAYVRLANDQEMLEMALVENIQRQDLNPVEIAITYQRLKEECGLTDAKLAERVGKSRATVTNQMRLLNLPPNVQEGLRNRLITTGHAKALLGIEKDYGLLNALYRETIEKGLSVRALERLVDTYKTPRQKSPKDKPSLPPSYENAQQDLRNFFGTRRLRLKMGKGGKGQIVIPFQSDDELNRLLDRIEE